MDKKFKIGEHVRLFNKPNYITTDENYGIVVEIIEGSGILIKLDNGYSILFIMEKDIDNCVFSDHAKFEIDDQVVMIKDFDENIKKDSIGIVVDVHKDGTDDYYDVAVKTKFIEVPFYTAESYMKKR